MNKTAEVAKRSRLIDQVGNALPRHLWESLYELQRLEYSRGVRDAVASLRTFRRGTPEPLISLRSLLSGESTSWPLIRSPREVELFEDELARTGRVPKGRPGRPRKDKERDQIIRLKDEGKSWAQIALKVKKTPDACRKLVQRHIAKLEAELRALEAEQKRLKKEIQERSS